MDAIILLLIIGLGLYFKISPRVFFAITFLCLAYIPLGLQQNNDGSQTQTLNQIAAFALQGLLTALVLTLAEKRNHTLWVRGESLISWIRNLSMWKASAFIICYTCTLLPLPTLVRDALPILLMGMVISEMREKIIICFSAILCATIIVGSLTQNNEYAEVSAQVLFLIFVTKTLQVIYMQRSAPPKGSLGA